MRAQLIIRLICKWKKILWKDIYENILIILAQDCSEVLGTFKLLPFTSAWLLTTPWSYVYSPNLSCSLSDPLLGSRSFLPQSMATTSLWFFELKTSVILDLFLSSYPTPGSFSFKIESKSKPLHSFPASTLVQTTSHLDHCGRCLTGISDFCPSLLVLCSQPSTQRPNHILER